MKKSLKIFFRKKIIEKSKKDWNIDKQNFDNQLQVAQSRALSLVQNCSFPKKRHTS